MRDGLFRWEKIYNTVRPHQALNHLTPLEFLQSITKIKEGGVSGENNSRQQFLPPVFKGVNMSYHSEKSWKDGYFQSTYRGQEFVIQSNKEIENWVREILKEQNHSRKQFFH